MKRFLLLVSIAALFFVLLVPFSSIAQEQPHPHYYPDPPNDYSSTQHYAVCRICGKREYSNHTIKYAQIGSNVVEHRKFCSECGRSIQETHSLSGWVSKDATTHHKKCMKCGFSYGTRNHMWGPYAYLNITNHARKCSECNVLSGAPHVWNYVPYGSKSHNRFCRVCRDSHVNTIESCTWGTGNFCIHCKQNK